MFDYDVFTEEEAQAKRSYLIPDGEYEATIHSCEEMISANSGNPMFKLALQLYHEGEMKILDDYLPFTPKMAWKIRHCCQAAGVLTEYESKKLHPNLLQKKKVKIKIKMQPGKEIPLEYLREGKELGSKYPDKNVIDDYIVGAIQSTLQTNIEQDIPF